MFVDFEASESYNTHSAIQSQQVQSQSFKIISKASILQFMFNFEMQWKYDIMYCIALSSLNLELMKKWMNEWETRQQIKCGWAEEKLIISKTNIWCPTDNCAEKYGNNRKTNNKIIIEEHTHYNSTFVSISAVLLSCLLYHSTTSRAIKSHRALAVLSTTVFCQFIEREKSQ